MDERIPEVLTALTLLLIGIFFIAGDVMGFLGLRREMGSAVLNVLSAMIFIFGLATAIVLLKDTMKKREDED